MTSLIYQTNGGGSLTLQATNTASNPVLTLPAVTGNVITSGDVGTITNTMLGITAINNVTIGASTPSTGVFTVLSSTSGNYNGTIGATTPSTGAFTSITTTQDSILGGTGQVTLPNGTTGQRSGSPTAGMIRFNSTFSQFEGYTGSAWGNIGGGATGGGGDQVFVENGQTVNTTYSIPASKNASSVGPITISSGVIVTVPSGSRWVVL
jgi:hypothetical protein